MSSKIIAEEPPKTTFLGRRILEASFETYLISITWIVAGRMILFIDGQYLWPVDIEYNIYLYVEYNIYIYVLFTYYTHIGIIIGPSFLCGVTLSALSQICHTDCKDLTSYFTGKDMARDESNTSEKVGSFGDLYPNEVPAPVACAVTSWGKSPETCDSSLPWATLLVGPNVKGLGCNFVRCEANIAIDTHSLLASSDLTNNFETKKSDSDFSSRARSNRSNAENCFWFVICWNVLTNLSHLATRSFS